MQIKVNIIYIKLQCKTIIDFSQGGYVTIVFYWPEKLHIQWHFGFFLEKITYSVTVCKFCGQLAPYSTAKKVSVTVLYNFHTFQQNVFCFQNIIEKHLLQK